MEDLGEMKDDDFVTSGEESSDNEDIFKTMVDEDMLGRDETAQKANIDPEARKKKDVAKLLGAMCKLSERQMKCRLGGWQLWRKLWEDILIWQVWLKL